MNIRLGLLVLLPFLVESKFSCCDRCWESCFRNVPQQAFEDTYKIIYSIVMGVRNLYAPCNGPRGTVYMLPVMMPSEPLGQVSNMKFHTTLAKIVAVTQGVDNEENPFFSLKYSSYYGNYKGDGQCRDKCEIADVFDSEFMQTYNTSTPISDFNEGLAVADRLLDDKELPCAKYFNFNQTNPLLIVFTGNDLQSSSSSVYNKIVISATPNTNLETLSNLVYPGLAYQVKNTATAFNATKTLASCIQKSCCGGNSMVAGKRSANSETFIDADSHKTGRPTKPDPTLPKQ